MERFIFAGIWSAARKPIEFNFERKKANSHSAYLPMLVVLYGFVDSTVANFGSALSKIQTP